MDISVEGILIDARESKDRLPLLLEVAGELARSDPGGWS